MKKGKRIAAIFLTICWIFSGCETTVGNSVPSNNDAELVSINKYHLIAEGINETENFFFGGQLGGHFLYFYDKTTGLSDFLCADPSCGHNSTGCGAYISQIGLSSFYNGKRYWVTDGTEENFDDTLWCGDLGGGNRKRIKCLPYETVGQYAPQQSTIYKGKLYMMGMVNTVDGVNVGMRISLLRTSLDDSETVETLFMEDYPVSVRSRMLFVGSNAYLGIRTWTDNKVYSTKIIKINVDTLEKEIVYEEADIPEMVGNFWVTEDGEIYIPGADKLWKIQDGKRIQVSDIKESPGPADIDGDIVIQVFVNDDVRYADIRDLEGNVLYQGLFFPNGVEGILGDLNATQNFGLAIYGGDPDKILVGVKDFGTEQEWKNGEAVDYPMYFLMLDLKDNMKPTLLWTATK